MSDGGSGERGAVALGGVRKFLAGAVSGAVAKTAVAPFDRTKILMQVSRMYGSRSYAGGVRSTMAEIWRREGARGFFRGNSATVARIMPYAALQYSGFEFYNRLLATYVFQPESRAPAKRFAAGSMAGVTSVLCTYPIDLARTRLAVESGVAGDVHATRGLVGTFAHVLRSDGVRGLYRGAYPTLVGVVPYSGTSFLCYGLLKRRADECGFAGRQPVLTSMVCGGSAGLTAQLATYSLDMVRRRLQALQSPGEMTRSERAFFRAAKTGGGGRVMEWSIWRAIVYIVRKEGLRGLYRGVSLNFVKTVPAMSISFTVYDWTRKMAGVPSGRYSATSG